MKERLFGTAGIRGITNQVITPQLALNFAQVYGSCFHGKIAVARDPRYGAEMLEQAILAGLTSTGCEVQKLGVVPLPIFARWVADFAGGGIMVTGSHIPPNQIGIVPVDGLGRDLCQRDEKGIEEIYLRKESKLVEWDKIKNPSKVNPLENYIKFLEKEIGNVAGFKVGLDLANGCFSSTARNILEKLGVEAFCINDELKSIPSRPSEPRKETLKELSKLTRDGFDLGAGTDVDGDRVVFLDSQGNGVSEDVIGAIFAKELVKANERVVTPINSSLLIEGVAEECGFKVSYCKIGPPAIAESILKIKATYAYEESGKYFFPPKTLWSDALLSTLKLLEILKKKGKPLEELVAEFPQRVQIKEKMPIKKELKKKVIKEVKKVIEFAPPNGMKDLVTLDGAKLIFEDGWLLIRPSGTENILRVYSDGKTKAIAEKLVRLGRKIVKEGIKQIAK
jgi:phosphomannomutase/phosphoglucomutase